MAVRPKRFGKYGLRLHPEKTKMIDVRKPKGGAGGQPPEKPEGPRTFDFLGLTHHGGRSQRGSGIIKRRTASHRLRRAVERVKTWCREHRARPAPTPAPGTEPQAPGSRRVRRDHGKPLDVGQVPGASGPNVAQVAVSALAAQHDVGNDGEMAEAVPVAADADRPLLRLLLANPLLEEPDAGNPQASNAKYIRISLCSASPTVGRRLAHAGPHPPTPSP